MNEIIINGNKSSKLKIITTPKIKDNIFDINKLKPELKPKLNYNIIDENEKNILINIDHNDNLTPLENRSNPEIKYAFNYERNTKNNILPNEKSTKTDDSSGEEKIKRKIQVQTPLNLTDKFNNNINNNMKKTFSNNKINKYNLTLSLINYISNKPCPNNMSKLNKESLENKNDLRNRNLIIKKAIYYKDYNIKKEKKNYLNKKSLTESNINGNRNVIKNCDNNLLYTQNSIITKHNTVSNFNKVFVKNKSYDCLKTVTLKNIEKKTENNDNKNNNNNQNIIKENNDICHYIKVNKKKINKDDLENNNNIKEVENYNNKVEKKSNNNKREEDIENININNEIKSQNIINRTNKKIIKNRRNKIYNNYLLEIKNRTYNNNEITNKRAKNLTTSFKKLEKANSKYNNNLINKTEQIKRKNIKIFDKNKLEHNIFLDKTYQNRFKKKPKNLNLVQNDIFTSDKQREYNTFIVKKKSNYLSSQILNSNNSTNSSNSSNKDWVYRLYNNEIKKQKIKNKIILLLRKSILNEEKQKKKMKKSKTVKEFKNYKYPINDGYNIDDNFNIINLFLSDDKKMRKKNMSKKKKKIKKCQSFHSYRNKQRKYSFDDNKIEDDKIGKLIEDKISLKNHRSYKKFRLLYNEELIDEEDEEKEQEKDEDEQYENKI